MDIVPPLRGLNDIIITSTIKKAELIFKAYFLPPLIVDITNIDGYIYPPLIIDKPKFTAREVLEALKKVPLDKAAGLNGIPNHILRVYEK